MHFFPIGGPKTPLRRLSSLLSMVSWVWFADVWAENVKLIYWKLSSRAYVRRVKMFYVLPVPVGPGVIT